MIKTLVISITVIFVLVFVIEIILKNKLKKTLADCLINKNYDLFDSVRNNKFTMLLFAKNDLYFYDLNKAIALKNDSLIDKTVLRLEGLKLTSNQKITIYSTVFYHYLALKETKLIKPYYEKLVSLRGEKITEEDILYDVYILNGYKYLDDVLKMHETSFGEKKSSIELMLSKMYENKNDSSKSKEYFESAKKRLNNN